MFEILSNIDWSTIINAVLAILTVTAGGLVIVYRNAISQVIILLNGVADVIDGKTSKEELAVLKQAWQDLVNLFKNYKGLKVK